MATHRQSLLSRLRRSRSRRDARGQPGVRPTDDLLARELGWDRAVEAAFIDEDLVGTARTLNLDMSTLRCELSPADAIVAVQVELEALEVSYGRDGDDRDTALERARSALRAEVVEQLRRAIEGRIDSAYALELSIDAKADLASKAFGLRAEGVSRLNAACEHMSEGGSIGIVGPSGIGKTRLLEHFCSSSETGHDPQVLRTVVQAGTPYDPLDFLKHLLAQLCHEVLRGSTTQEERSDRPRPPAQCRADRARVRWSRLGAVLAWGGTTSMLIGVLDVRTGPVLFAGTGCLILAATISRTGARASAGDSAVTVVMARLLRKGGEQLPLIGVGVILIAASQLGSRVDLRVAVGAIAVAIASAMRGPPRMLLRFLKAYPSRATVGYPPDLADEARELLARLEHDTTTTLGEASDHSVTLGKRLVLRSGAASTGVRKLTQAAWTLAEAHSRLNLFVCGDAKDMEIWIGIDLQRMEPEKSQAFLEDIGPVLRLKRPGCHVLISVLGDGDRVRAVVRCCDRVIPLNRLCFEETRGVLCRDDVGLSLPFAALCHVLSGGVPSHLVSHARTLQSQSSDRVQRISDVARALVAPDLKCLAEHVHASAIRESIAGSSGFLAWVSDAGRQCGSVEALLSLCARRANVLGGCSQRTEGQVPDLSLIDRIEALADELVAHCYFAATVLAFFDDGLSRADVDHVIAGEPSPLEILQEARWTLSMNARHSASLVREFRVRCALEPCEPVFS
jgi:hypothetical protein